MAVTYYEIDSYKIFHLNEDYPYRTAGIHCYKGNALKGYLSFYKDLPVPASYKASDGRLWLRFNEHKFRDIIETLRLEKPLYLYFNDVNRQGFLGTSYKEPIGEEEAT